MKIRITLTRGEILEQFAAVLGFDPKLAELEVADDEVPSQPEGPTAPGKGTRAPSPKRRFLGQYMEGHSLSRSDVATLTEVSESTVKRAMDGYWLNSVTQGKIIRGLGLTDDEIRAFNRDMTRHQR